MPGNANPLVARANPGVSEASDILPEFAVAGTTGVLDADDNCSIAADLDPLNVGERRLEL